MLKPNRRTAGLRTARITSRLVLPLVASEIVLISMRRSLIAKPGFAVATIVVGGGFLKYEPDLVEAGNVVTITQINLRLDDAVEAGACTFERRNEFALDDEVGFKLIGHCRHIAPR